MAHRKYFGRRLYDRDFLAYVNSVLPLSITDFTATSANTSAQLQWNAAAGGNSSFFDVESSRDGTTWQDIGAAANAVYSPVKTVYIDVPSTARLFPNAVRNRLFITGSDRAIQSVIVTGAGGKEVARYTGPVTGNSIDVSSLPGGMYFVTIGYASGLKQTTSIVKY